MTEIQRLQEKWHQHWRLEKEITWQNIHNMLLASEEYIHQAIELLRGMGWEEALCLLFEEQDDGTLSWESKTRQHWTW